MYIAGLKEGEVKEYYPNGSIKQISSYKTGLLHSKHLQYHKNGNIELSGEYNNGEKVGEWNMLYEDGKKRRFLKYYKNEDGLFCDYKAWYTNGNLADNYIEKKDSLSHRYMYCGDCKP